MEKSPNIGFQFSSTDTNKDGAVEWSEFEDWANQTLQIEPAEAWEMFQSMDIDHTGKISLVEWQDDIKEIDSAQKKP